MSEAIEQAWRGLPQGARPNARALAKAAIHDALEKARNSVPVEWKGNLDYIEKIETAHIEALRGDKDGRTDRG